jgi:16S rRNA (cytosine1402-N4)-methyltransferase
VSSKPTEPGGSNLHIPVMAAEVLRELITDGDGVYCDLTLGLGGHAESIMEKLSNQGRLIGIERDDQAAAIARERLSRFGARVTVVHRNYRDVGEICRTLGVETIAGALADLGLSSLQLDDSGRGFSYQLDGPLDLRFDRSTGQPASDWLNEASEQSIASVLAEYGEEPRARQIARRIVATRAQEPVTTTTQLREIVIASVGRRSSVWGRACARCLQAIRIFINSELNALPVALKAVLDLLAPGGRLVVIAYHSLEDRIVKEIFREAARRCDCPPAYPQCVCGAQPLGRIVHRKVLRPTEAEVAANPRSRSARMRVFEKEMRHAEGGAQ